MPNPQFHFVTISTTKNQHLRRLEASAAHYNIPLTLLGLGDSYEHHGKKIHILKAFIKDLPKEDILIYVDAFDVIFLDTKKAIETTFLNLNQDIVFGAEHHVLSSSFSHFLKNLFIYPKSPTSYRYVNAGTFAGYIGALLDLFNTAISTSCRDDQIAFSNFFIKNPKALYPDYEQKLFTCNGGRGGLEEKDYQLKNKKLVATKTNQYPKILHIPGKVFIPLDNITQKLGIPYEAKHEQFDYDNLTILKKVNQKPDRLKMNRLQYFFLEKLLIYIGILLILSIVSYCFISYL